MTYLIKIAFLLCRSLFSQKNDKKERKLKNVLEENRTK